MSETFPGALVPPGEGKTYWIGTDRITIKATGAQTAGAFGLIEVTIIPQGGPPPHKHTREDEWFYILEGELTIFIGGSQQIAPAGSVVHAPKNIPHGFRNLGATPAKILVYLVPAGIENFFAEAGTPVTDTYDSPVEMTGEVIGKLMAIAPKYGLELIPPE